MVIGASGILILVAGICHLRGYLSFAGFPGILRPLLPLSLEVLLGSPQLMLKDK